MGASASRVVRWCPGAPEMTVPQDRAEPPPGHVARMNFREKLDHLYRQAKGKKRALVLTHDNPDPDCLASAVALAFLL